jgi:hypothetical protein
MVKGNITALIWNQAQKEPVVKPIMPDNVNFGKAIIH